MSLASTASLIVASLDLQLVQDIVGAIRAADANAQAANAGRIPPVAPTAREAEFVREHRRSCDTVCCGEKNDRRQPLDSACCYKPDRQSHWKLPEIKERLALTKCGDAESAAPFSPAKSPIEAPWKQLPWKEPAKQVVRVKIVQRHTDIVTKGSLIDTFI